MNDTQSGRVLINWKVTALLMVALMVVYAAVIEVDLRLGLLAGLGSVGSWLALELYRWERSPSASDPESDE